jgi:hypothetical protein
MADWVRPGAELAGEKGAPRWGHRDGLQVGLAPLPGPRGLIRVFAPYLGHPRERLLNFVAVEPIPAGVDRRGFSELEASALDGVPGKRFWSADSPDDTAPGDPLDPAPGVVETAGGAERLTVFVMVERFDSGADVYVRVRFDERRPHEVALAVFARPASVPLSRLVLTATMGNWARLRRLRLRDRVVEPRELWPGHTGDGFTGHAMFGLGELGRGPGGAAVVTATPDEDDPAAAQYAAGTHEHWRYRDRPRCRAGGWTIRLRSWWRRSTAATPTGPAPRRSRAASLTRTSSWFSRTRRARSTS